MKRGYFVLIFMCLINTLPVWAESPVSVGHLLANYSRDNDEVVLTYLVNIKNTGNTTLTNLRLSFVPLLIKIKDDASVKIENLLPQEQVQIPLTITTMKIYDDSEFIGQPLFWAGTSMLNDSYIEFPVSSIEGGVL